MANDSSAALSTEYSWDQFLSELWKDAVVPFFKDKSLLGRVAKATVASTVGSVAGHLLDGAILVATGRRSRIGRMFGSMAGSTAGWFTPEILQMNWGQAASRLDENAWREVERKAAAKALRLELGKQLGLLELRPTATHEEFQSAYRRAAIRWHPDRCPGNREAVVRMAAINAARDEINKAYSRGELPLRG